jgi:hypothetical protein
LAISGLLSFGRRWPAGYSPLVETGSARAISRIL